MTDDKMKKIEHWWGVVLCLALVALFVAMLVDGCKQSRFREMCELKCSPQVGDVIVKECMCKTDSGWEKRHVDR